MFPVPAEAVEAVRWQLARWEEYKDVIPLLARTLAVISTYVILVIEEHMGHTAALQKIAAASGTRFDPAIVGKFIHLFDRVDTRL